MAVSITRGIFAVVMAGQLAACGGDINSTPAPPVQTPLSFPLAGSDQTSQAITATSSYTGKYSSDPIANPTTATLQSLSVSGRGSQPAISYNATSGTYTLQSGTTQVALSAANKVATTDYSHAFHTTAGTATDDVILYGNALTPAPAAAAPVALTYASYGLWKHSDTVTNLTTQTFFLYGAPTGTISMPKTGSASYQATASGIVMASGPALPAIRTFVGTASLSADFSASTVLTTLNLGIDGTYQGTGSITADQFSGPLTAAYQNFSSGSFTGGFFGPNAAEAGYAFKLIFLNPDPYAGASPAPANIWFSGVAVGKKN